MQREAGGLAGPQREPGGGGGAVDREGDRRRQQQPVGATPVAVWKVVSSAMVW